MVGRLQDVSWLPFNNFMHYLRHAQVDLRSVFGSEYMALTEKIGGNCIYKAGLAEAMLKPIADSVHSVVDDRGTHHAVVYCVDQDLYFFDPCLFMTGGLKVELDFACGETLLTAYSDEMNYVALEYMEGSVFTSVWGLNIGSVSRSWYASYDLNVLNQIPVCDWIVEPFKPLPNALIFRYFNCVSQRLEQLSLFLSSRQVFVSEFWSQTYISLNDIGAGFADDFFVSVSVSLSEMVDCMFLALDFTREFERW